MSLSCSLSSCTCFSKLYRKASQIANALIVYILQVSIICDINSKIFKSHDLINTLLYIASLAFRLPSE